MSKQKRTILDDIEDGVRQVIDDLDKLLNPDKHKKRAPVPVPVRVRPDQHDPRRPQR